MQRIRKAYISLDAPTIQLGGARLMPKTNINTLVEKASVAIETFYQEQSSVPIETPVGEMIRSMKAELPSKGPFDPRQLDGEEPLYSCSVHGHGTPVTVRAWYDPANNKIKMDYLD